MRKQLERYQVDMIRRALEKMATTHDEHARVMDQLAKAGGNAMLSEADAKQLAKNHRAMATDARDLLSDLNGVYVVEYVTEPEL